MSPRPQPQPQPQQHGAWPALLPVDVERLPYRGACLSFSFFFARHGMLEKDGLSCQSCASTSCWWFFTF